MRFFPVLKWVDDFLVIRMRGQTWTEDDFIQLTAELGVLWAADKTRLLSAQQQYIRFI